MFQSSDVQELTGLTRSQLREWCGSDRRNILPPDVKPRGPGKNALYHWRTVLVLRLLKQLRDEFGVELGAWAQNMRALQAHLSLIAFHALWGRNLLFSSAQAARIIGNVPITGEVQGLIIPLDPHLMVIATRLQGELPPQMNLFPALAVAR